MKMYCKIQVIIYPLIFNIIIINYLLQTIYPEKGGQESGFCTRTYRECEFEVKDKSGDQRRKVKKKREVKLKVIQTKKADSAGKFMVSSKQLIVPIKKIHTIKMSNIRPVYIVINHR